MTAACNFISLGEEMCELLDKIYSPVGRWFCVVLFKALAGVLGSCNFAFSPKYENGEAGKLQRIQHSHRSNLFTKHSNLYLNKQTLHSLRNPSAARVWLLRELLF